jgi:hypothetical protein
MSAIESEPCPPPDFRALVSARNFQAEHYGNETERRGRQAVWVKRKTRLTEQQSLTGGLGSHAPPTSLQGRLTRRDILTFVDEPVLVAG